MHVFSSGSVRFAVLQLLPLRADMRKAPARRTALPEEKRQSAAFQGAGRVQNELPRSVRPHKAGQINIFGALFRKAIAVSPPG